MLIKALCASFYSFGGTQLYNPISQGTELNIDSQIIGKILPYINCKWSLKEYMIYIIPSLLPTTKTFNWFYSKMTLVASFNHKGLQSRKVILKGTFLCEIILLTTSSFPLYLQIPRLIYK